MTDTASVGLWLGTQSQLWGSLQFKVATSWAVAHGIDTLYVKLFDGSSVWYGGPQALNALIGNVPLKIIPYGFSYGDSYQGLTAETAIARNAASVFGTVCLDVEQDWWDVSIAPGWASRFVGALQGYKLIVSCQANFLDKGDQGLVMKAFSAFKDVVFAPQCYDAFLNSRYQSDFTGIAPLSSIQPTFALDQSVGPNDVLSYVKQAKSMGIDRISLWEYGQALNNPSLVANIGGIMQGAQTSSIVPQSPGQEQQAKDVWNIGTKVVTALFPGVGRCDYNSGIGKRWQLSYWNGVNLGYPCTPEIATVNWNGDKIVVVWFSSGSRIEWDGQARIYP